VLLTQLRFGIEASELPSEIGIALLEYYLPEEYLAGEGQEESQVDLELLDADFFDDECVVIIYRLRKKESQCKYYHNRLRLALMLMAYRTVLYCNDRL
jgi:hypothetical protein